MLLVSTISLVMAEASDGKAVLPPSKEGDAERDPDPLDASPPESQEAGERDDSSIPEEDSSSDETDSTAGDLAKQDLRIRRFVALEDLPEENQKLERSRYKEYGAFAKPGKNHETATSYMGHPLKKWMVHFYPKVAERCKAPPTKSKANLPAEGWEALARQNKGALNLTDPADDKPTLPANYIGSTKNQRR